MKKKIERIVMIIVALNIFISPLKTYAIDGTTEAGTLEEMMAGATALPVQSDALKNWPKGPTTNGRSAIVMEAGTGAILYAKNIDDRQFPASITKLLTALIAFEKGDLSQKITVSDNAVGCLEGGYANIGLKPGEIITLKDAIYATLLASANEAAYVTGEGIAANEDEDYSWFIRQMNQKCQEIGAVNSHFVNTNGMPDSKHYTTARDMALITRELYQYPEFFNICQTPFYKIDAADPANEHAFSQSDKMLIPGLEQYYEGVTGGKTGYTEEARSTLVTTAQRNGMNLICVVLHTYGSNSYNDTKALLDYGFDNFEKVDASSLENGKEIRKVIPKEDSGYVILPSTVKPKDVTLEIHHEQVEKSEADVLYLYQDQPVGVAKVELERSYVSSLRPNKKITLQGVSKEEKKNSPIKWIFSVVLVVLLGGIFIVGKRNIRRKRRRRRRR